MLTKRTRKGYAIAVMALMFCLGVVGTSWAIDISSTLFQGDVSYSNTGLPQTNLAAAFDVSAAALVDGAFMEPDALNAVLTKGTALIHDMPPSNRILVEGFVLDDGVFTSQITGAQSVAVDDTPLMPTTPVTGDAVYIGMHNPGRIIWFNTTTASTHNLTITWEYWTGSAWAALSNVNDGTAAFTRSGFRTISFDMPTDATPWMQRNVTASAFLAYWARGRIDSVTTTGVQPLAAQVHYETGQWWAWVDDLPTGGGEAYTLYLGGPDLVTHHQLFPGLAGIETPDDAALEPGSSFAIEVSARLNLDDFTAPVVGSSIIRKGGALRLFSSSSNALTLEVTGASVTSLTLAGLTQPVTGTSVVQVISNGSTITLNVVGLGSVSGTAQTIGNNADPWIWGSGLNNDSKSVVYFDRIRLFFPVFENWDTQAEWDLGTKTTVTSFTGPPDPATTETMAYYVPDGPDDGHWTEGLGSIDIVSTFTRFGNSGVNPENAFFRLGDMPFSQGQTVPTINYQFICFSTRTTAANIIISAVDQDDAGVITGFADAEARPRTTATVAWNPPTSCPSEGVLISTPDLSAVFQEVIDRPGWARGNHLIIFVEDNASPAGNERTVHTADSVSAKVSRFLLTQPISIAKQDPLFEVGDTHSSIDDLDAGIWCESDSSFSTVNVEVGTRGAAGPKQCNAFLRFPDVAIAQGTEIQKAYIEYYPRHTTSSNAHVNSLISGVDEDDAAAPTSFAIAEAASRTAATLSWIFPIGTIGVRQVSADITSIVQEIVDRPGWATGNAMTIYIEQANVPLGVQYRRIINPHGDSLAPASTNTGPRLIISPAIRTTFTADYVRLSNFTNPPPSWTNPTPVAQSGLTRSQWFFGDTAWQMRAPAAGAAEAIFQDVAASPGQVWSVQATVKCSDESTIGTAWTLFIRWLDSGSSEISNASLALCGTTAVPWGTTSLNGQTAPALTAFVRWEVTGQANALFFKHIFVDGAMACICATAPSFPDVTNALSNESFEEFFQTPGEWKSQTFSFPTVTNVGDSTVIWSVTAPDDGTFVAQSSIDGEASWQTIASSGSPIPLVNPGDDISSTDMNIRFNFTASSAQDASHAVGFAQVQVVGPDTMDYRLNTLPGVLITDRTGNGHDGVMSYPIQHDGVSGLLGPILPRAILISGEEGIGIGEVAGPVTAVELFDTTETGSFLPGSEILSVLAITVGWPLRFFWAIFAFVAIIVFGAWAYIGTGGSVFFAAAVMGIAMAFFAAVGTGIIPGWSVLVYMPIVLALIIFRRALPL